jgi:hypothetical protein
MNRKDRRRYEAQQRRHEERMRRDAEERVAKMITTTTPLPDDIKRDIAKTVRSIEWAVLDVDGTAVECGLCFYRAVSGMTTLCPLDIWAKPALGGMIYRAGPDERRDVVGFCGPGNVGIFKTAEHHMLAHYFVVSGDDIIDFSVGDWKENITAGKMSEMIVPGVDPLGPIQWTAPPLTEFFWAPRASFEPVPGKHTPELGQAWYTGFASSQPSAAQRRFETLLKDAEPTLRRIVPHIRRAFEHYALKERVWATRNGHTAVRLSQLARLVGDPDLTERVTAGSKFEDKLIVLRGKVEITADEAARILAEAGIQR